MKIGDLVECVHDQDWMNACQARDWKKAQLLGKKEATFIGNASAYMHCDEVYKIVGITEEGGLRLDGFCATVSAKDVRLSTKTVYR